MKKKDFIAEIKNLGNAELNNKARDILEELMKLRFRNASGQYESSHRLSELKKNLARVKTAMSVQANAASK